MSFIKLLFGTVWQDDVSFKKYELKKTNLPQNHVGHGPKILVQNVRIAQFIGTKFCPFPFTCKHSCQIDRFLGAFGPGIGHFVLIVIVMKNTQWALIIAMINFG